VQRTLVLLAGLLLVLASACGNDGTPAAPTPASTSAAPAPVTGSITVFAASSLTDAFNQLASAFKAANPRAAVTFNFAGSPTLVTQLDQGASADVLATADQANMQSALDRRVVVDAGRTFARNRLTIIVPKRNAANIHAPSDLAKPGLKLVLAQASVPAGKYARQILANFDGKESYAADFDSQVLRNLVSEEANVKAVVTKVQLGEADAGIVYATDVTPGVAGDLVEVPIPDTYNVIASYPIAVTSDASNAATARAFIGFLLSAAGQAILEHGGFLSAE
jgi:molybdate transport system substrate-binding protein